MHRIEEVRKTNRAIKRLESPFDMLTLNDCESIILKPVDWEFGTAETSAPWLAPGEKRVIEVVRVHLAPEDKPLFPHYYDIPQRTLIPQIMAILTAGVPADHAIKIHAVGRAPEKKFEVSLVPV